MGLFCSPGPSDGGGDPVQPDLIFVSADQRGIIKRKYIQGVPKLLVELVTLSSMRHDRVVKLNKYASCGVPHYWIGDPHELILQLFRLQGNTYTVQASLGPGDRFEHPDFPGLVLDLDALFASMPPELAGEAED